MSMIKLQQKNRESLQGSLPFDFDIPTVSANMQASDVPNEWDERWLSISGDRRKELISPFMYYADQDRLVYQVHRELSNYINTGGSNGNVLRLAENKAFSSVAEIKQVFKEMLSDHLITDIYNLYYYKPVEISFGPINATNKGKFLLLQSVNDAALKIVTAGNSMHTTIFVIEICMALIRTAMDKLSQSQIKELADCMNQVKGGDQQEIHDQDKKDDPTTLPDQLVPQTTFEGLVQLMAGRELEEALASAKKAAFDRIAALACAGIDLRVLGRQAGITPEQVMEKLEQLRKDIKKLSFNTQHIRYIISRIIDQSVSFFSSKVKYEDCSLFDADDFEELEELEWLHPVFSNSQLESLVTTEARYFGKLNVYVDISSSMNDAISLRDVDSKKVAHMPALLFAKALLLKMLRMNVLAKVIPFGHDIKQSIPNPGELDILLLEAYCGTSIDRVVRHCEDSGENALVITDCQDHIREYSRHVFIVGTPGAQFFLQGGGMRLKKDKQLWLFDHQHMNIQAA